MTDYPSGGEFNTFDVKPELLAVFVFAVVGDELHVNYIPARTFADDLE